MAPAQKRKHAATEDQQTKMPVQTKMERFAGVSKKGVDEVKKRRKMVDQVTEKENVPDVVAIAVTKHAKTGSAEKGNGEDASPTAAEKKRKRYSADISSDDDEMPTPSIFKQFAKKPATDSKRHKPAALPPSPAETPSKKAAALFSTLHLSAADKAIPFVLSGKRPREDIVTPPPSDGDDISTTATTTLPSEVQALAHLHTAFLSALALHYAHNGGTASPVNVATLLPQITKTWKVRAVTLNDLQRILSPLLHSRQNGAQWVLEDFGPRAGVRLSQRNAVDDGPIRGRAPKRAASGFIDQEGLNASFKIALQERWSGSSKPDATAFLANLPLAPIIPYASSTSTAAAPSLARGAQRLADLKSAAITTQHQQANPPSTANVQPQTTTTAPAPASRSSTLLDRILARQQTVATLLSSSAPLTFHPSRSSTSGICSSPPTYADVLVSS